MWGFIKFIHSLSADYTVIYNTFLNHVDQNSYFVRKQEEIYDRELYFLPIQKQPFGGVLKKMCSENMHQIYKRAPMLKYYFIEISLRHGCSAVNLLHIFRTAFLKNTSGRLPLPILTQCSIFIPTENARKPGVLQGV